MRGRMPEAVAIFIAALFVAIAIMRWTEGPAYRMIDKDSSRRSHLGHYV